MEEKCGWETGPNRVQHETFLKAVLDMLLEKAVFEGTNRKNKLVEWQEPEELKQKMNLAVREEGMTHGELFALMQQVVKYSVKTGHPYFINQLYSGLDVYGLVGQWVTDALNPSVYTYEVAPVFTLMEIEVLSAMASLVGFEQHDGLFSPGGSISNMYGMLLARYRTFPEIKSKGCSELGRLVALTSIDAHYSLKKAAMTLGLGSDNLVLVNTDAVGRMDVNHLKHCIEEEKKKKSTIIMVCATAGTTVLGAYDPVAAIADVCEKEGIWLHVDAAWGGGALISPALRHKIRGIHRADSVTWNPHKLLVAPQQCSVFLTRHPGLLKACNSASAAYLFQKDKFYNTSYDTGDQHLQCGRRADVLKFWAMWKAKGTSGLAQHMERVFSLAEEFAGMVSRRGRGWRLLQIPECTNVCFWYLPPALHDVPAAVLQGTLTTPADHQHFKRVSAVAPRLKERMVREGRMMITYQPLRGRPNFFRLVLQSSQVTSHDLEYFINTIEELAQNSQE
ncbi:hypothetical protein O3P69_013218 [Scylla paramamosain]|uniref:Cysteine sulfinic acid decarboxylase n=2 Tax=Scylla paramamosain TaxID=85552 RepID=A0AAW0U0I8_SCYPA